MMFESLAELDAAIEAASQILQMSRECGFQDCVTAIVEDIRQVILPGVRVASGRYRRKAQSGCRKAVSTPSETGFELSNDPSCRGAPWKMPVETAFTGLHIRGRTYCPGPAIDLTMNLS
jgi:hypothetical protein